MRGMVWFLLAALALVIVLLVVRWRLMHRVQAPLDPEPFDGDPNEALWSLPLHGPGRSACEIPLKYGAILLRCRW